MPGHTCPPFIGRILLSPLRRLFENPDRLFSSYIKKDMLVLEPGCGMGYFTIPLARMVGLKGRVIAIDIQDKMLAALYQRAIKAGVSDRIEIRRAAGRSLSIDDLAEKADFAVAIHMVHEVPDQQAFFREIFKALKPGGRLLVIEPRIHVSRKKFTESLDQAGQCGFMISPEPLTGLKALLYKHHHEY